MFILTWQVSCLTTSSFPWFMDLTLKVPMQCCSLQHWTLVSPLDMSATECHFCFGPAASFFLKLLVIALCSSPVAYQTPSKLSGPSSGVISFCSFILFMGFSWQEYWSNLQFLLLWTTFCQNSPPWPVYLGLPCTAWLTASLSYISPFTTTRLWSVKMREWW